MACVLFDVDGTLFDNPSTESRFIGYLFKKGEIGPARIGAAMAFYVRGLPRYGRHVARKNKAYLTGLPVEKVASLAEAFVRTELLPRLRPFMRARIEEHRRRGDTIALLTGTPDFIAAPLAHLIGADVWRATRCAAKGGRYTAGPPIAHPLGEEKLVYAKQLCEETGVRLEDCIAYADSIHDMPLLQQVGMAVTVIPDHGLTTAARHRGWSILGARARGARQRALSVADEENPAP